jgi:hypothetical protein
MSELLGDYPASPFITADDIRRLARTVRSFVRKADIRMAGNPVVALAFASFGNLAIARMVILTAMDASMRISGVSPVGPLNRHVSDGVYEIDAAGITFRLEVKR